MHLGEEVPLDSLGSDVTGVTFHEHLSTGVLKGRQSILPHGDGTLPPIQLPLLGKSCPCVDVSYASPQVHGIVNVALH
jgi:hypothetical protein